MLTFNIFFYNYFSHCKYLYLFFLFTDVDVRFLFYDDDIQYLFLTDLHIHIMLLNLLYFEPALQIRYYIR